MFTDPGPISAVSLLRPAAIAHRLAALRGHQRVAAAIVLGMIATAALPPVYVVPLLIPAFTGLVWLLDGSRSRAQAFWTGWWFGLGHFAVGLYWISDALFVDIGQFWWLLPPALLGVPAGLAIFTGLATLAARLIARQGLARVLAFAACWALAEYARGHLLTGFPWNLIGYAWVDTLPVLQSAAWFGIYGLSLVTVLAAALPAVAAGRGGTLGLIAALALITGLAGAGALRLDRAPDPFALEARWPGVQLRLVQPSIAQTLKWDPVERGRNFDAQVALSTRPAALSPTVIIWPEAATADLIEQDPPRRAQLRQALPEGARWMLGTPRRTAAADGSYDFWNGLVVLDKADQVEGTYDKFHLVPFGEYVPLAKWLPIEKIASGFAHPFASGPGPRTLHLPGLPPVGPLICYEVIFPGAVADPADRPAWLLNVTNDGWFGRSSGPMQHFAMARVRAVEEGIPLVRAANTGISGVVDPWGRVVAKLGLEHIGIIDTFLPRPAPEPTWYRVIGDGPYLGVIGVLLIAALAIGRIRIGAH